MKPHPHPVNSNQNLMERPLLFIGGKGGVGRTTLSRALARLKSQNKKTLWVNFDDPLVDLSNIRTTPYGYDVLNVKYLYCFEEYLALKLKSSVLAKFLVQNKLMSTLTQVAPGVKEIVALGKVWHLLKQYEQIVVDLPSTGYALALFQSTVHFAKLFKGSPIQKDAEAMLGTFGDSLQTGLIIVTLPEEMPLVEAVDMANYWNQLFPKNQPSILVNKIFPGTCAPIKSNATNQKNKGAPIAHTFQEYVQNKLSEQSINLSTLLNKKIPFDQITIEPDLTEPYDKLCVSLAQIGKSLGRP